MNYKRKEKLEKSIKLTSFSHKSCTAYYRCYEDNLYNDLSNRSYTKLVWDQVEPRKTKSLSELALELGMVHRRTMLILWII